MDDPGSSEIARIGAQYGGVDGFLRIYSDITKEAAKRLLTDERMHLPWARREFDAQDFEDATHVFELARCRIAWDGLTQRMQSEWIKRFDKTVSNLVELLEFAPTPVERFGFPVRGVILAEAARRMGVDLPELPEKYGMIAAGIRLERDVDPLGWTLVDSLEHYRGQVHMDATIGQPLAKPRDGKAARAFFLNQFQECRPKVSAAVVAIVASIMFQDDVSDRKVREHRPDGLSEKRKNPA